jgi:RNA polymerase sigma-54 factor
VADLVFVNRGGEWVVSMNEEDLRLSRRYRPMLVSSYTEIDVKEYVKERSARRCN